ncbi:MAG: hypothetical protein H6719_18600 [Sandaracinaceae bacterium]|nr:hypothetical protein [Sandaracinaceae bacterium]
MRSLRVAVLLLASCAAAPAPRPTAAPAPEAPPPVALPPLPEGCVPTLVASEARFARFDLPAVSATGAAPPAVGYAGLVARVAPSGPTVARYALGAAVVALATRGGSIDAVGRDGSVYSFSGLDALPTRIGDVGSEAYPILRGPPGGLVVRDSSVYGTLLAVEGSGARPLRGVPASSVADAAFVDADHAVVLLVGGLVGHLAHDTFTAVPTAQPVRALVLAPDGIYGELAPTRARTDFSRPPEVDRVRLAAISLDVRHPDDPAPPPRSCQAVALGPTCEASVCSHALTVTCGGVELAVDPLPGPEAAWIRAIGLGTDDRFLFESGGYFSARVADGRVRFEPLELPRGWSRELARGYGPWVHLPSTRDHHAPGETDVLFRLDTGDTIDLGAFRGRERSTLLADGTLAVLRLADDRPRLAIGPLGEAGVSIDLPDDALDVDFLDARRGVAVGADGGTLRFTCDGGETWRPVPFEGGERAMAQLQEDRGDQATPGLVRCEDDACAIALAPPVTLDFDASRAASAPRPLAPIRPTPPRGPDAPVRRLTCRAVGPRPAWTRPPAPTVTTSDAGCAVSWERRLGRRVERGRAGPFDCARLPAEAAREAFAITRLGVLLGDPHATGATWIVDGGEAYVVDLPGRLRALSLSDGRVLVYSASHTTYGPRSVALLDATGVAAERAVDFGYRDPHVGVLEADGPPRLLVILDPATRAPRAWSIRMDTGLPEALTIGWDLCPRDPRRSVESSGPTALVAMPPIYFDGPDERPYAYAAALRLGPTGTCLERVRSWRGDLESDGARLEGEGFVCESP